MYRDGRRTVCGPKSVGQRSTRDRRRGREWFVHVNSPRCNAVQVDGAECGPHKRDIHASRRASLGVVQRGQSKQSHMRTQEEELVGGTSFGARRCHARGRRSNHADIFLGIASLHGAISRVWKGPLITAILVRHPGPETSFCRTHLAVLVSVFSVSRTGMARLEREVWGAMGATCEEHQGMLNGGC